MELGAIFDRVRSLLGSEFCLLVPSEKSNSWKGTHLMAQTAKTERISREDIEAKLRALQGDVQGKVEDRKSTVMVVAGGIGVILVVVFFLLGRRSGKRRSTVVEIRRV